MDYNRGEGNILEKKKCPLQTEVALEDEDKVKSVKSEICVSRVMRSDYCKTSALL